MTNKDSIWGLSPKTLAAVTIFLGSFLSFGVQPLIGRTVIASFGGTAAVWIVCLCAFQVLLLAGYFYADRLSKNPTRRLLGVHGALLLAAAVWAGCVAYHRADIVGRFAGVSHPVVGVLGCVLALVALPYVLLTSNASLVQSLASRWDANAYRLYAVSNIGSIGGLLAYPFVFEPYVGVTGQWLGLAIGIVIYAALLFFCARHASQETARLESVNSNNQTNQAIQQSNNPTILLWLLLPLASCFLLDALTTHITSDVMPMPLIWTVTLTVFLLSYVVGFSGRAERLLNLWAVGALASGVFLCMLKGNVLWKFQQTPFPAVLSGCLAFLFFGCTFLHAWLYAVRPHTQLLTRYYASSRFCEKRLIARGSFSCLGARRFSASDTPCPGIRTPA